jgi:hypothetical protein
VDAGSASCSDQSSSGYGAGSGISPLELGAGALALAGLVAIAWLGGGVDVPGAADAWFAVAPPLGVELGLGPLVNATGWLAPSRANHIAAPAAKAARTTAIPMTMLRLPISWPIW